MCETSKPTLSHGLFFLFCFDLESQSPYSIPHLCPPPPSLSPTTQPPPPLCVLYSMSACPSVTVCLPVSLCLSSCLLSCCLSLFCSASCLVSRPCLSCLVYLSVSKSALPFSFTSTSALLCFSLFDLLCIPTNILTLNRCRYFGLY